MSIYSMIFVSKKRSCATETIPELHLAGGRAVIDWMTDTLSETGSNKITVYTSSDKLKDHLEGICGASDKASVCRALEADLPDEDGCLIAAEAGFPTISSETLKLAYKEHIESKASVTEIKGERASIYLFDIKGIDSVLSTLSETEKDELGLAGLASRTEGGSAVFEASAEEMISVFDCVDLSEADRVLNKRKVTELMMQGVRILNPETVRADAEVKVGADTVIYPNTILEGATEIGSNCVIGPNSRIVNCKVGKNTEINSSVVTDSEIGDNTAVGPFAYIRPNSKIGNQIKVGDFVEVKNAVIGDGTKISHLTYVGDADVGERVNFGCGTVVVNYDGINKHRTTIEDDCFIGCNTNLVSPVTVRQGAYTAAGSTITDEVPADALAIARARQVVKDGWAKGKKK